MFLTISLVIFFLLFFILFVPCSIELNVHIICDRFFLDIKKMSGFKNEFKFKLGGIIPIYKKTLFLSRNKQKDNKKETIIKKAFNSETVCKLLNKSYVDKLVLSLGFNLNDYVANSYVNTTINTLICMYINLNQEQFNLKRLYYQTYVSENLVKLNLDSIIKITLADTIKVMYKEYMKVLKQNKKKVLVFEKRSEKYGGTSN